MRASSCPPERTGSIFVLELTRLQSSARPGSPLCDPGRDGSGEVLLSTDPPSKIKRTGRIYPAKTWDHRSHCPWLLFVLQRIEPGDA